MLKPSGEWSTLVDDLSLSYDENPGTYTALEFDDGGEHLFVADPCNHRILKVHIGKAGSHVTIAGAISKNQPSEWKDGPCFRSPHPNAATFISPS